MKIIKLSLLTTFLLPLVLLAQSPLLVKEEFGHLNEGITGEAHYRYDQSGNLLEKRSCFYHADFGTACTLNNSQTWAYDENGNEIQHHYIQYVGTEQLNGTFLFGENRHLKHYRYNPDNQLEYEEDVQLFVDEYGDTSNMFGSRFLYTFSPDNCLATKTLESLDFNGETATWVTNFREVYENYVDCKPLEIYTDYFDGSSWNRSKRNSHIYNSDQLAAQIIYYRSNNSTEWSKDHSIYYEYNNTGQLIEKTWVPEPNASIFPRKELKEYLPNGQVVYAAIQAYSDALGWYTYDETTTEYQSDQKIAKTSYIFRYAYEDDGSHGFTLFEDTYEYNEFGQLSRHENYNETYLIRDSITIIRTWEDVFDSRCDGFVTTVNRNYLEWFDPCNPQAVAPPNSQTIRTYNKAADCETAVAEYKIMAYPNPSNGFLTVESALLGLPGTRVALYSSSGQKIRGRFSDISFAAPLDLSGLPNGIYFLQISNGDEVIGQQVLLQQ